MPDFRVREILTSRPRNERHVLNEIVSILIKRRSELDEMNGIEAAIRYLIQKDNGNETAFNEEHVFGKLLEKSNLLLLQLMQLNDSHSLIFLPSGFSKIKRPWRRCFQTPLTRATTLLFFKTHDQWWHSITCGKKESSRIF